MALREGGSLPILHSRGYPAIANRSEGMADQSPDYVNSVGGSSLRWSQASGGVFGVYMGTTYRGDTLTRGSQIACTAPVGKYEVSEKPAVQQENSVQGKQKFSFVPRSGH